jgi:release factor glutamine methyltransferase
LRPQVNLNAVISNAAKKLEAAGIEAGAAEAEIVLCELLDFDRLHLYLHGPSLVDDNLLREFDAIIDRRATRYPLQYILGSAWFYNRRFIVNEAVMVPCPETELLLESVLRIARSCKSNPVRLLDVGVGSGVIAVSAKLENEALDVTAVDISPDALGVARQNADALELDGQVRFIQSDLFESLDKNERFDIIASNPPYIADHEYPTLPPEVKADPKTALLGGEKGLDIIVRLLREAPDHLNRPGYLLFEIGYDQSKEVFALIENDSRYAEFSLLKDLADIDRIVICKVP